MPSTKNPKNLEVGPGQSAERSVPESALTFALGDIINGGAGGTVVADDVVTYASDPAGNPFDDNDLQENLEELATIIPEVCEIGDDGVASGAPNSGVPVWNFDSTKVTGGFRVAVAGDFGLLLGDTAETFNIIQSVDDVIVSGTVCPADRGTLGILHIAPDGTETEVMSVGLSALFNQAFRHTGQVDYHSGTGIDLVDRLPVFDAYPGLEYDPYPVDWTQYQLGKFTFTIDAADILVLKSGSLRLLHVYDTEPFVSTSAQYGIVVPTPGAVPTSPENPLLRERFFVDTDVAPVFTQAEMQATALDPAVTPVWLSGILGYGTGEQFTVSVSGQAAQDSFNTSSVLSPPDVTLAGGINPLSLVFTGMGLTALTYGYHQTAEGWGKHLAPAAADTFSHVIGLVVAADATGTQASPDAHAAVSLAAPYQTTAQDTVPDHVGVSYFLISACDPAVLLASQQYTEFFVHELMRFGQTDSMEMGPGVVFPSTLPIDTDADNTLALQVDFGGLVWPQTNYSAGYLPANAPGGQEDYSGFAADPLGTTRFFQRYFEVKAAQRGVIRITGNTTGGWHTETSSPFDPAFYTHLLAGTPLTAGEIATRHGQIVILIKVPGVTGWMDLGRFRGDGTTANVNGAGCLYDSSGTDYTYDLGEMPLFDAAGAIFPAPTHLVAVRVYYFMDALSWVLARRITKIEFVL